MEKTNVYLPELLHNGLFVIGEHVVRYNARTGYFASLQDKKQMWTETYTCEGEPVEASDGICDIPVRPLPLTRDILSANGWEGGRLLFNSLLQETPFAIIKEVLRKGYRVTGQGYTYINHTHQLQLLLAAYGMPEEVSDFKI